MRELSDSDGSIWDAKEINMFFEDQFPQKKIGKKNCYYWMKKLGLRYSNLRRTHYKSSPEIREKWKVELPLKVKEVKEKYDIEPRLIFMDEHRMDLQPILRKQWRFRDQKVQEINIAYKWTWVYSYVEPKTGEIFSYLCSHLNKELFQWSIDEFAKDAKISKENPVLLILDGAPAHRAKILKLPEGLEFHFLPAYSPELQPAERLWPLFDRCIANQCIKTIEELEQKVFDRCKWMRTSGKEIIRRLTSFHWLPTIEEKATVMA